MINETETRTEEFEMTLAEASELYNRKISLRDYKGENLKVNQGKPLFEVFGSRYHFNPFELSELAERLSVPKSRRDEGKIYISGRLYIARENGGKIEIRPIRWLKEQDWKRVPEGFLEHPSLIEGENTRVIAPTIFPYLECLNLDIVADHLNADINGFTLSGRTVSLEEMSRIPLWKKPEDCEAFIRKIYGSEQIDKKLRAGERFYAFSDCPSALNKDWTLVTPSLSNTRWGEGWAPLFRNISSKEDHCNTACKLEDLRLWGTATIPREYYLGSFSFDACILQDYVQPKDIGNGVIAMSSDRIPKYLKRRLGFQ
jgi:hypothetical protein